MVLSESYVIRQPIVEKKKFYQKIVYGLHLVFYSCALSRAKSSIHSAQILENLETAANGTEISRKSLQQFQKLLNFRNANHSNKNSSCQLITTCVHTGCTWSPKLAGKCAIKRWFPCGADGRSGGVRSRDY